ncbi:putative UDP-glucuronate:xylan alpha-glucuronosyltransferase 4 [Camellia lanceoleosa]|uniref:UDP-glucuronate:xylan alpha-glucuronosyltransferase 4 n=1 Tax=Camellia lanceoleosa TaxID=1840588 RepID=A0ACC0ITI2_9ERIC|nr:putative UDP-glucuronate:xylan alpha-glucuronosyltransferase 4 [Camellia lanceoleosa]
MAVKQTSSKIKPFTLSFLSFLFLSLTLFLLLTLNFQPKLPHQDDIGFLLRHDEYPEVTLRPANKTPRWYTVVAQEAKRRKIKVGLVNIDDHQRLGQNDEQFLHGLAEMITVGFDRVDDDLRWEDFFPEWIDEDEKWSPPSCPEIPMPRFEEYGEIDVVVAKVPCGGDDGDDDGGGVRNVFRLQVNLMVANLLVRSGWENNQDRTVYAVFIGSCGPMWEIFRCDDLLWNEGEYWVYKPDLRRLKQKVIMPLGSCQLAPPYAEPGREVWRRYASHSVQNITPQRPREAYVTILHSSETYVCGAIALAQSIIQTNSTKDLVLLADDSISRKSLQGLRAAGWKVKHIDRIRSPYARKDAYNEWNYSKLRVWELTNYDKVIFIDADLIVLKNMDGFFVYPQLSAIGNDKFLFNSGVMLVEPSKCTFETLMEKRYRVTSYNGGDQGFLNEMFTWWHRWPSKVNHLKISVGDHNKVHDQMIPKNIYTIHYLGLKPWMCYMDYDCNWDMLDRHRYASDAAHQRWWQVYKAMPKRLQSYCALSEGMDARIRKWRKRAKGANFPDGHWKIKVKDLRQLHS